MVDRIKQVMEHYEETPAGFAEKIGVNRSNLTHLFSGRNQPSLDFAKKILVAFPEVSTEWLIMGVGNMIKDPTEEVPMKKTFVQTDLFGGIDEGNEEKENNVTLGQGTVSAAEQQVSEMVQMDQQLSLEDVPTVETMVKSKLKSEQMSIPPKRVKLTSSEKTAKKSEELLESENIALDDTQKENSLESKIQNPTVPVSGILDSQTVETGPKNNPIQQHTNAVQSPQPQNVRVEPIVRPAYAPAMERTPASSPVEPAYAAPVERTPATPTVAPAYAPAMERTPVSSPLEPAYAAPVERTPATPTVGPACVPSEKTQAPSQQQAPKEKKIEKIIFFYDDDSFKVYHP